MFDVVESMKKEMLRRNYSRKTILSYLFCLKKFLKYYRKEPRRICNKDVKEYLDNLVEKRKSGSSLNVNLCALKFLMREILNKNFVFKIKFSKVAKELPIVLDKEEVVDLINCVENKKHKLMIRLMYGGGLRVSELVNLRVRDLELEKGFGWVRRGKGNKDRLFIIAENLRKEVGRYIECNKLEYDSWLFEGNLGHLSVRSVQEFVKKATKKAGIKKRVHPHTFRHSFATHLIENGYGVSSVQSLLGHNNIETTMVYVHMTNPKMLNVKSPLDSLQLEKEDRKSDFEDGNLTVRKVESEKFRCLRI